MRAGARHTGPYSFRIAEPADLYCGFDICSKRCVHLLYANAGYCFILFKGRVRLFQEMPQMIYRC